MTCTHTTIESVAAAENGMCPLCLQAAWQGEHARAEKYNKRLDELTALAEDMVNTINYGWNGEKLLTALAKWRGKCIAEDAIEQATKGGTS